MNINQIHDTLEDMYQEDIIFFTASDVKKRLEEKEGVEKSSSRTSSRIKNYEKSERFEEPKIEQYAKPGNSRIYVFSDKIKFDFPYFNKRLEISEIQTVIDFFREELEDMVGRELNKKNITKNMEFTLELRDGNVEAKIINRKKLKGDEENG